ncbi:LuxR C-terminal-related transcriptional regulator [Streptomyces sp. NPDC051180]|uniref:helix-turn-helix transcriptional regulator n=1 Tax=unclassified Streptomyces TaxID=2593676 RepID=UPI003450E51B
MQETERTAQRRHGGRARPGPGTVPGPRTRDIPAEPPAVRPASWSDSLALVMDALRRSRVGELCLMLSPELLGDPRVCEQARALSGFAVARGTRVRVLLQAEGEDRDRLPEHVRRIADTGALMRTMSRSGGPMIVLDDDLAVLPMTPDLGTWHCTLLRGRTLVAAYRALFDATWRLNARFDGVAMASQDAVEDALGLTPREREALRLLAEGLTDEGISRRTGLSVRTLRRVIAGVMLRMGAQSRFQAGAEAARRHWI